MLHVLKRNTQTKPKKKNLLILILLLSVVGGTKMVCQWCITMDLEDGRSLSGQAVCWDYIGVSTLVLKVTQQGVEN